MEIIRAREQSKELNEQFHHQLERAHDGFSVIADYFARGVFNKVRQMLVSKSTEVSFSIKIAKLRQRDETGLCYNVFVSTFNPCRSH